MNFYILVIIFLGSLAQIIMMNYSINRFINSLFGQFISFVIFLFIFIIVGSITEGSERFINKKFFLITNFFIFYPVGSIVYLLISKLAFR